MNTKRIIFWACFIAVLALIVWGLIVAMNKPQAGVKYGTPPEVTALDHVSSTSTTAITVIEYSDFQCPACSMFYPAVERLIAEASSTIRVVYRHYPLYPQPHANALIASQASEAAAKQGKFWEMYRNLFDNQAVWDVMTETEARTEFAKYAVALGLDMTKYAADFESEETKNKIAADQDAAIRIGVNSTPTFFVNGKQVTLEPNYEKFKAGIEAAAQ